MHRMGGNIGGALGPVIGGGGTNHQLTHNNSTSSMAKLVPQPLGKNKLERD